MSAISRILGTLSNLSLFCFLSIFSSPSLPVTTLVTGALHEGGMRLVDSAHQLAPAFPVPGTVREWDIGGNLPKLTQCNTLYLNRVPAPKNYLSSTKLTMKPKENLRRPEA